jgi:hypothetical protein
MTFHYNKTGANLALAANTCAKAGFAENDGTIVSFRSKYRYNLLRPVTCIQKNIKPGCGQGIG